MEKIITILITLYPTLEIPQRHLLLWQERERKNYTYKASLYFSLFIIAYIYHFYYVDIPLQKKPIEDWQFYRFSCASVGAFCWIVTMLKGVRESKFYRAPAMVAGLYFTFFQALSMVWREAIPYYYVIALSVISSLIATPSLLGAFIYFSFCMLVGKIGIDARPNNAQEIYSAAFVSFLFLGAIKSNFKDQVRAFVIEMQNLETEREKIKLIQEMKEQIKTFLPTEIFNRYMNLISNEKKTSLQAMDEVLRQRKVYAAVLMSDIRGYTQMTKNVGTYIKNVVAPDIQNTASVADRNSGVTRIIGDETFVYYDSEDSCSNISNAFKTAFEIMEFTLNSSSFKKVERYVIISFGEAMVGNIGALEGYRHITIQGPPANICSRIDPITKNESFKKDFDTSNIIATKLALDKLIDSYCDIEYQEVDISSYNFTLKDFPDEKKLFIVPVNAHNKTIIFSTEVTENIESEKNLIDYKKVA